VQEVCAVCEVYAVARFTRFARFARGLEDFQGKAETKEAINQAETKGKAERPVRRIKSHSGGVEYSPMERNGRLGSAPAMKESLPASERLKSYRC
jgi:hypothetical protein